MTRTVSTCTFPLFAGFSTCETFLAFALALSLSKERLTFRLFALSRALSFVLALPHLWLGVACLMARLLPFPFRCLDPLPDAFDVLDFAPAHAGDLTLFLQHHTFNLTFHCFMI